MKLNYTPYKLKPEAELNISDPVVVFDPLLERTPINRYISEESENTNALNSDVDTTRVEGVLIPLVKINSQVININDLRSLRLNSNQFIPTIELSVAKADYIKLGTPGMVNKITVVMLPAVDGPYKKITVDFDITSVHEYSTSYVYTGNFFLPELQKRFTKSIKHNGKRNLTTYELFYEIAKDSKLGYAVTEEVEKIQDTKVRLLRNQNYIECIDEHLKFSGLDNQSFFKAWIDIYGYLVISNMSWVMGLNTGPSDYSIVNENGLNFINPSATNSDTIGEETKELTNGENTFRTITNWRLMEGKQNNQIEKYEWLIDNFSIQAHGTDNMYYAVDHIITGGKNNITSENIKIEDQTAEGKLYPEYYLSQKNKFIGVEMGSKEDGNTPVLYQEKRRTAYFTKLNYKQLKVTMAEPNYGLERGIMIQVSIFEYDRNLKIQMLNNMGNTSIDGDESSEPSLDPEEKAFYLDNENMGILNTAVSGMYFINGMEYTYKAGTNKINQILYLIKRGESMSYINAASKTKF